MIAYCFVILTAVLTAIMFGKTNAENADDNMPIHHDMEAMKSCFMVGVCLLVLTAFYARAGHLTTWCMLWIPIAFGIYTPIGRIVMNLSRKKPLSWYYLGPHIRGPRESWYDGLLWGICRAVTDTRMVNGQWHITYSTEGFQPGIAATLFELTVLGVSSAFYFLNT